jgi:Fic family protein
MIQRGHLCQDGWVADTKPKQRARLTTRLGPTSSKLGPAPGGRYRHWDTFRHVLPLTAYSAEEQWLGVKMARRALYRPLPLRDLDNRAFQYAIPAPALEMLLEIDRNASGNIQGSDQVTNPATRDTYLFKSIVEEAITSSQLEGASTTRKAAKAMIQEGRAPRDRSERMILNNYRGMLYVRDFFNRPLTPALVMELQRVLTEETLDDPAGAGRFRTPDEDIVVEDETGTRLHGELDPRQLALIHHALKMPSARYTVESHRISHRVSYETARSDLLRLADLKLLAQHKVGKAFVFTPAEDLLRRLEARLA